MTKYAEPEVCLYLEKCIMHNPQKLSKR